MTAPFHDHFSTVSAGYALHRPRYPTAFIEWLVDLAPRRQCAWDCGTGNGQVAAALAPHFDVVVATDASAAQLEHAEQRPNVNYRCARAEAVDLETDSVDLVTVAQALHWFDVEAFHAEAHRVLRRGGIMAQWCYAELAVDDVEVQRAVSRYHDETMAPWWPPERALVSRGYRDIPFPFEVVTTPEFSMEVAWNRPRLADYFRTWSSTRRCLDATAVDPVIEWEAAVERHWPDPLEIRTVRWPLTIRVGRA